MTNIQLGKFKAAGQEYQRLQINRTLGPNIGDQSYLGRFSSSDGNHNLALSVHDAVIDTVTQYRIFTNMSVENGVWTEVLPSSSSDRHDIVVSVRVDGVTVSVRLTRLSSTTGPKEYRVKCLNLRPYLENYAKETDTGIVPPQPSPIPPSPYPPVPPRPIPPSPYPPVPPSPYPPVPPRPDSDTDEFPEDLSKVDVRWLARLVMEHLSSVAPHMSHEIVARKDKPYGYAGLDADGHIKAEAVPTRGVLTIKLGDSVIVYDGSQNIEIDFNNRSYAEGLGVAVATGLTTGSAASDNDIAALFDDDMSTPDKASDDPGYIVIDDDPDSDSDPDPDPDPDPDDHTEP